MSAPASPMAARIDAARDLLGRARRLACAPSTRNLELCCGVMAAARDAIQSVAVTLEQQPSVAKASLEAFVAMRSEILLIGLLLDRAAGYHARLLATMTAQSPSPAPDPESMAEPVEIEA